MKSEVDRYFHDGFVLDEREIRRIYDIMLQQMKHVCKEEDILEEFSVKYRNNLVSERSRLDEILSESNGGVWSLEAITIVLGMKYKRDMKIGFIYPKISIKFEKSYQSIIYRISGDEREWVYITSSQLEERIAKTKRTNLEKTLLVPLITGVLLSVSLMLISIFIVSLVRSWSVSLQTLLLLLAVTLGLSSLMIPVRNYFYPLYNFCWGDYLDTFTKRQNRGNLIVFGVLGALALGIIGSVIATLLTAGFSGGH